MGGMTDPRAFSPLDRAVAALLRERAGRLDVTQAEIADAAGIPRSSFGRYWHGERSMTIGQVEAALAALGTTYSESQEDIRRILASSD